MSGNFPGEMQSIKAVVTAGEKYGYGNMIHRLQMAWVLDLWNGGVPWETAAVGALLSRREIRRILKSVEKDEAKFFKYLKSYTGKSE